MQDSWSHVVSASVTPVVVISAAALLCLAFYNRLAAIVLRLRAVQRERLELQDRLDRASPGDVDTGATLRQTTLLESLSEQSVRIRRRARLIRSTLLLLLGTIAALIITSLLAGLSTIWHDLLYAYVLMFGIGLTLLLAAISCAAAELVGALGGAELETSVVSELTGFATEERHHSWHHGV